MRLICGGVLAMTAYAHGLDLRVAYYDFGSQGERQAAQVEVIRHADEAPLAALRLRMHFREGVRVSSVMAMLPDSGAWSSCLPRATLAAGGMTAWAMAPAAPARSPGEEVVARFELDLDSGQAALKSAEELFDSARVETAIGPAGKAIAPPRVLLATDARTGRPRRNWPGEDEGSSFPFKLGIPGRVRAYVTDRTGARVAVIADRYMDAGLNHVSWDGKAGRRKAAPGRYVLHVESARFAYARNLEVR